MQQGKVPDTCPRCGEAFHCGIGDAAQCPCTTLALDAALLQRLRERFSGCLCLRCLGELAGGAAVESAGAGRGSG